MAPKSFNVIHVYVPSDAQVSLDGMPANQRLANQPYVRLDRVLDINQVLKGAAVLGDLLPPSTPI